MQLMPLDFKPIPHPLLKHTDGAGQDMWAAVDPGRRTWIILREEDGFSATYKHLADYDKKGVKATPVGKYPEYDNAVRACERKLKQL